MSSTEGVVHEDRDFRKAHDYYLRGNYEKAISQFSEIILSSAGEYESALIADAYWWRAECRKKTGKYSLARFDYDQAVKITEAARDDRNDPDRFVIHCKTAVGDTYMYEGAYLKADGIFDTLLHQPMLTPQKDGLNFRRYICAAKLGTPRPEQYSNKVRDWDSIDEDKLRREFLGGGTATHLYQRPKQKRKPVAVRKNPLAILPRSAWNAGAIGSNIDYMTPIYRITVHHTADYFSTLDYDSSAAQIRAYQSIHQDVKGWADIGYHFFIDRAGRIWEGRELRYQGAHAGNSEKNRGNIGVCLLGDFEQQEVSPAQKKTLAAFLKKLCRLYKIDARTHIFTHRELHATECPGRILQDYMNAFRNVHS